MADNKGIENCKCNAEIKNQTEQIEDESFALSLLREYSKAAHKWFIISMVILCMWLATIGGFLWFLNQYNFESYEVTQDGDGYNNYVGNDGDIYNEPKDTTEKND